MSRRARDEEPPPLQRKKSGFPLWAILALAVGGLLVLIGAFSCFAVFAWVENSGPSSASRNPDGSTEPVPTTFDHADGQRALHWWVASYTHDPSKPVNESGNAMKGPFGDWGKERVTIAKSKPVRWKLEIVYIDVNARASLKYVSWPASGDDYNKWLGEKAAEWEFPEYHFELRNAADPGPNDPVGFPIRDKAWAKTLSRGSVVILAGSIERIDESPSRDGFVAYRKDRKEMTKYNYFYSLKIRDGVIEKP
jgi:hypothetical protein